MILQVRKNINLPQWYTGIGVTLMLMQSGFMGGWASPTLPRLLSPESTIPLNTEEASWVASLVNLGRFFGAVIGAIAVNYLGTKRTIFITLFPIAFGWLIISFANSFEWLYLSRLSSGVGRGMTFSTFALYIGEISLPEIRGALVSLATFGVPVGQVISSVCCAYLSMSTVAIIYLILCIFLMLMFFLLPESPHHLIAIENHEAAIKSIYWYRAGRGVDNEFDAIKKFVNANKTTRFVDKLQEFRKPAIRRATIQIFALFTFMQIGGLNTVIFYMEMILKRLQFTLIDPSLVFILSNIFGALATGISIFLIDRFGRRFLLLISSIGVTVAMFGLMCNFMLVDLNYDTKNLQWLSMGSMFLFVISFFIGLMPVPSAVLSETFPANIKCIAACISSLTAASVSFFSAKTYQPLVDLIGETYVFLIYVICSMIVIPYAIFIMPETKGKSLQEIQDELMK